MFIEKSIIRSAIIWKQENTCINEIFYLVSRRYADIQGKQFKI